MWRALLLLSLGCNKETELLVELRDIPPETRSLEARFTFGGRAANIPQHWDAPSGFHPNESFVVKLPAGGPLAVAITARDAQTCITASAEGETPLPAEKLVLPLLTEGRVGCPVAFTFTGSGSGSVLDCHDTCTVVLPKGMSSLTAVPDSGSTFLSWGGDCSGDVPCSLDVQGPRSVSVRFDIRGLSFARSFGGGDNERVLAAAFDSKGNVYLGGSCESPTLATKNADSQTEQSLAPTHGGQDGFVVKLNPAGEVVWTWMIGGPGTDSVYSLAIRDDRLWVAGDYSADFTFQGLSLSTTTETIFALELSLDGALVWGRSLDSDVYERPAGLTVAANGVLFVGAQRFPSAIKVESGIYAFPAARDSLVSHVELAGMIDDGSNNAGVVTVAADPDGVVATGYFSGTIDFGAGPRSALAGYDGFALALTQDLGFRWLTLAAGMGDDHTNGVAVDAGQLVVVGEFVDHVDVGGHPLNGSGGLDGFVARLNRSDGSVVAANTYATAAGESYTAVASDGGRLAVIGFSGYEPIMRSLNLFMAWLEPTTLNVARLEAFGSAHQDDYPYAIAVDRQSTVGVGTFKLQPSPGGRVLSSAGELDGFAVKWSGWP